MSRAPGGLVLCNTIHAFLLLVSLLLLLLLLLPPRRRRRRRRRSRRRLRCSCIFPVFLFYFSVAFFFAVTLVSCYEHEEYRLEWREKRCSVLISRWDTSQGRSHGFLNHLGTGLLSSLIDPSFDRCENNWDEYLECRDFERFNLMSLLLFDRCKGIIRYL